MCSIIILILQLPNYILKCCIGARLFRRLCKMVVEPITWHFRILYQSIHDIFVSDNQQAVERALFSFSRTKLILKTAYKVELTNTIKHTVLCE